MMHSPVFSDFQRFFLLLLRGAVSSNRAYVWSSGVPQTVPGLPSVSIPLDQDGQRTGSEHSSHTADVEEGPTAVDLAVGQVEGGLGRAEVQRVEQLLAEQHLCCSSVLTNSKYLTEVIHIQLTFFTAQ